MKKLTLALTAALFTAAGLSAAEVAPAPRPTTPKPVQCPIGKPIPPKPEPCLIGPDAPTTFPKEPCTVAGGFKGNVGINVLGGGYLPMPKALVVVKDKRGVEFARTKTNSNGNFTVNVPPAEYTVEVYPSPGNPTLAVARFKSKATEKYTKLTIRW